MKNKFSKAEAVLEGAIFEQKLEIQNLKKELRREIKKLADEAKTEDMTLVLERTKKVLKKAEQLEKSKGELDGIIKAQIFLSLQ